MASVVSMRAAMEEAFCKAERVTLVGSITPDFTRSSYCAVAALKPKLGSEENGILDAIRRRPPSIQRRRIFRLTSWRDGHAMDGSQRGTIVSVFEIATFAAAAPPPWPTTSRK
jgi:hypothetical protein